MSREMIWRAVLFGVLIVGGLDSMKPGVGVGGSSANDRKASGNSTVPDNRKSIGYESGIEINSANNEIRQWKNLRGDKKSSLRRSDDSTEVSDVVNRTCLNTWKCPHYCINRFKPAVSLPNEKFRWEWYGGWSSPCPNEIEPECAQVGLLNLTGNGDNSYCYISFHGLSTRDLFHESHDGEMIAIFHHETTGRREVQARRKCGLKRNCFFGYCLKRRGGETTCGQTQKSYQLDDPHPDCLWKTADNSSLRISEDEWCCRTPDGCETPVGKCSQNKDCFANYCIGIPGRNQSETRCPEGKNETEWEECGNLKWGQTRWIPRRNVWCCIPEKNNGCDYKVRSCGLDLSCRSVYCFREREGDSFRTTCPEVQADRRCESLQEGQELILSAKHMCCRTNECLANGTICGNNPICEKDYCVAWKTDGSSELTTACPTVEEDRLLKRRCMVISIGSTLMVKKDKVWCCKRRHCSVEDPDESTSIKSTKTTSSPAVIQPDPSSLLRIVLAVLIMANVVTCGSCCVGIVCYRLVIFEKKRGRKLRRTQVRVRSSQESPFEKRVDAFLEKILHGDEASDIDPTEASMSVAEETEETGEGSKNQAGELIATQQSEATDVTKTTVFENESKDSMKQE